MKLSLKLLMLLWVLLSLKLLLVVVLLKRMLVVVFLLELLMLLMELRTFEKLFCTTSFLRSPLILQNSLTNFIILHFISGLD